MTLRARIAMQKPSKRQPDGFEVYKVYSSKQKILERRNVDRLHLTLLFTECPKIDTVKFRIQHHAPVECDVRERAAPGTSVSPLGDYDRPRALIGNEQLLSLCYALRAAGKRLKDLSVSEIGWGYSTSAMKKVFYGCEQRRTAA